MRRVRHAFASISDRIEIGGESVPAVPCSAPSCCHPSFGCGGFGGFYVPTIFIGPRGIPTFRGYTPGPEERFGAKLRITGSLEGSKVMLPGNVVEGWFAEHVKGLDHQVEAMSPTDFLGKIEPFFSRTGMKEAVGAWVDDHPLSVSPDNGAREHDMSDVVGRTIEELRNHKHVDQLKVEAGGRNADFEMHQILLYRHVHDVGGPAIFFDVLGLPLEWSQREGEDELAWMQRVNAILDDKDEVHRKNAEAGVRMETLARDYQKLLAQSYFATNLSHSVQVDFGKIVL